MLSPHVTGDSLADAIVGASLAISRSPPKYPTSDEHPSRSPAKDSKARGSSPHKTTNLRHTLRKESSGSSSDDKHRMRIRRHPNKHDEGNRKRWREKMTEEEYKRYAGLWASNRGYYIADPARPYPRTVSHDAESRPEDEVLNLVVREVWKRSRLSPSTLSEIWELVDDRRIGQLTKNQFIVGLWLIDQRLKGSKLPIKVSQSLWDSVKRFSGTGVKIRVP
ncbi:hypothetical protein BT63DRAFT_400645 [Microthyrium microscopicum]|uniref:EH domain-containing protein n=1 Tax=Microthyrium microscopicum TaxID=703497 RepID=A0A6A6UDM5_9PEZI|nr:hypothetical protein BT63DRAFT_400645 [Microthyrium microscopicum]